VKNFLLTFSIATLLTLSTSVTFAKQLLCRGVVPANANIAGIQKIELKSGDFQKNFMYQVMMAVQYVDYKNSKVVTVGRRETVPVDKNYRPRVYTNFARFDMAQLVDTNEFGNYYPADQCQISFMVPQGAETMASFQAPVVMNCEQSGGSATLQCKVY
jgi:hypothetical protein